MSSGDTPSCASTSSRTRSAFCLRGFGFERARFERATLAVDAAQLAADPGQLGGGRARARGQLIEILRGPLHLGLGDAERDDTQRLHPRLGFVDLDARRRERVEVGVDRRELLAHVRGFGDQRLDDSFVGDRRELAVEAPGPFAHEVDEAAAALAQRLGAGEHVGHVVVAGHRERVLGFEHLGVEPAQLHPHVLLGLREIATRADALLLAAAQLVDLAPGEVQPDRVELGDEPVVAAGGIGLAFERAQLAPHLAQEIGEPEQVALGRLQPALGLLLALAELEDAGGLLDDRPAVLGPRVQHRVELALADDHVLLAADAGVGEQVLDVEQPAGHAVHQVLGLTGAEEHPGDRDLGELDREQARRCCRS